MEEKYKKFKEFEWEKSKEWQLYWSNLYPTPPVSKIERYKRKFYKNKIDSDFDIDYKPSETSNSNTNYNSNSNSNSTFTDSNSGYSYTYAFPPFKPINSVLLKTIETYLLFFFLFSLPFRFYSKQIAFIAYLLRTLRLNGIPKWKVEYLQGLMGIDSVHVFFYSLVLFIERFNYYLILPVALAAVIDSCENIKDDKNLNVFKKYFDLVLKNKENLLQERANIEVGIGFLLIVGVFLKLNSFLLPIIYWQLMKVKYFLQPRIKKSFEILNSYVNKFKNSQNCPNLMKIVIEKIQWLFEYFGKVEPKNQNSSCMIF
jgi:hypothetical protein